MTIIGSSSTLLDNMENNKNELEFNVLGYRVKLRADEKNSLKPSEIIEYVCDKAAKVQKENPSLDRGQVAILVALGLAGEKITLEKEFRENIDHLQSSAFDALTYIEEVSPTPI